ncbi:MAG: DM13 domain-containing protein [Nitrospira sp.]|nr:DM13 domain-containing protein [Nitrospira sp.]
MMKKDEAMTKDHSMTKTDKGMMGQKDGSMMAQKTGMMEGKMAPIRTGMLAGAGSHHAAGTASLTKDQSGHKTLNLTDIRVDQVPDGRVYLAKNGDYRTGIELGKLTQFSGMVDFPIPGTVNLEEYDSVVIWCKQFNVEIGRASLGKVTMEGADAMMDKKETMMEATK